MDGRLIPADPALVRQVIARRFLAAPAIDATLGDIRLEPHQVDAAARLLVLLTEGLGALLADATGLGKTYVAIAVARMFPQKVIVVPAALRSMWRESLGKAGVVADVITYEAVSRGAHHGMRPALLVLDEAHHARNPRTRRYASLADLAWGTRVLLLSATPVHNRGRDVRAMLALFLGSRAYGMTDREVGDFILRRELTANVKLPRLGRPQWLEIAGDRAVFDAIAKLPRAVPTADGRSAHALLTLGLIRAWASSEEALRETLRRRLRRVAAFTAALDSGQRPDRRLLESWPVHDDAVQLGFPGLYTESDYDCARVRSELDAHAEGVRALLSVIGTSAGASDGARFDAIRLVRSNHPKMPIVAFTQFADTARAMFHGCMSDGGVAMVTGRGARVAAGRVTTDEVVRGFDSAERRVARALPFDMLIATDVLSEGLSLRRAGVLVHLDLPWTAARLEQRLGRLRRYGSPHRSIAMYAIGPPVGARELVHVVRTLQRKIRLSSGIVGASELDAALPLIGARMERAISNARRRTTAHGTELLRAALARWTECVVDGRAKAKQPAALALVEFGGSTRLVGVVGSQVVVQPVEILDVVTAMSSGDGGGDPGILEPIVRRVYGWIEGQRGRQLARLATDSPSVAHREVLRRLHLHMSTASRAERHALAVRVERCRDLVMRVAGVGAEAALHNLLKTGDGISLQALETLLEPRVFSPPASHSPRLLAIIALDVTMKRLAAAWDADCAVSSGSAQPGDCR